MDDRTRGWLLARLVLAVAIVTVIAIPLLGLRDPMATTGMSTWESYGTRFGPIIAEALAIAGLVWMLRIWRDGGRDSSAAWRYRDELESIPLGEQANDRPDDRRLEDARARGWLVARLELAIAVVAVLVATIIVVTYEPPILHGFGGGRGDPVYGVWDAAFPYVGEALAIIGLVWMVRIWRGPTRDAPPEWRYRK